jgi:hypothetical protein
MKIKTLLLSLFLVLTFVIFPLQVHAAKKILHLGATPFYKVKNLQAEFIPTIVQKVEKDVKIGFDKAGAADLFDPFMDQIKSAQLEEVQIQPGETLQWMLYKKKNKVRVSQDVIWAGKKPFRAYRFVVQYNDKNYEFIFPAICLNISLKGISDVPKQVTPPPPPPRAEAPVEPPPPPPKAEEPLTPPPPPPPPPVVKKGFIVVDAVPLWRMDPSNFALIRAGYMYNFTDKLALTGLLGFAGLLNDSNDKHSMRGADSSAFTADLLFSFFPTKQFYLAVGVGEWFCDNSTFDGIGEVGFQFMDYDKRPSLGVFLEGRSSFSNDQHKLPSERIGFGFRLLF